MKKALFKFSYVMFLTLFIGITGAEAKKDQAIILTEEYKSYEKAKKYLEDANSMYSELGDYRGIAHTLKRQGVIMEKFLIEIMAQKT